MGKKASFLVSPELLVASLHLPKDTEVLDVQLDPFSGCVEFLVRHDDLADCQEGQRAPRVLPLFQQDAEGKCRFVSWGA